MKIFNALLFCLIGMNFVQAQATKVAILDFENTSGKTEYDALAMAISSMLITDLANNIHPKKVEFFERSQLNKLLDEQKLQKSKNFDANTAVDFGKLSGVNYVFVGSVFVLDGTCNFLSKLVDVQTSKILLAKEVSGTIVNFLQLKSQLAEAIAIQLNNPITLDPSYKDQSTTLAALNQYGKILTTMDQGDIDKADQMRSLFEETNPDFKYFKEIKDDIDALKKKLVKVEKDIELTTTDPVSAAKMFDKNEDFDSAEKYYLIALKRADKDDIGSFLSIYRFLAELSFRHKKYEKSISYCNNALQFYPFFEDFLILKMKALNFLERKSELLSELSSYLSNPFVYSGYINLYEDILIDSLQSFYSKHKMKMRPIFIEKNHCFISENDTVYLCPKRLTIDSPQLPFEFISEIQSPIRSFKASNTGNFKTKVDVFSYALNLFCELNNNVNSLDSTVTFLKYIYSKPKTSDVFLGGALRGALTLNRIFINSYDYITYNNYQGDSLILVINGNQYKGDYFQYEGELWSGMNYTQRPCSRLLKVNDYNRYINEKIKIYNNSQFKVYEALGWHLLLNGDFETSRMIYMETLIYGIKKLSFRDLKVNSKDSILNIIAKYKFKDIKDINDLRFDNDTIKKIIEVICFLNKETKASFTTHPAMEENTINHLSENLINFAFCYLLQGNDTKASKIISSLNHNYIIWGLGSVYDYVLKSTLLFFDKKILSLKNREKFLKNI